MIRPLQLGRMLHNWGDCTPIFLPASRSKPLLLGEDVVPLVFVVCTLFILTWGIPNTLIICSLRWLEGWMLYFDFSTIDALLLCCSVYHICMLTLFWDDSRSMMIYDYLVFGHFLILLCDGFFAMIIYFIKLSLYVLYECEWCK